VRRADVMRAVPPEASPVFVLGADHSGTTILYRMLAYHRALVWFSQFSLSLGEIPGRSRRPVWGRLDPLLRRFPHSWQKDESRLRRLVVPRPGEEGQIWNHLLAPDADATRVRSCLTAFSRRFDRRMLAKRPAFHRHLDMLHEAFPGARFVHIVRDGRAVALSLRDKDMRVGSDRRELDPGHALRDAAARWVDALDRAERATHLDLMTIRYEDLCEDVHGLLEAVLDHCGLDRAFPFRRCPTSLSNRNGRWLDGASDEELDLIWQLQGDVLTRYGYPATPSRNSAHPRPPSVKASYSAGV
jgi:hypothetical protein